MSKMSKVQNMTPHVLHVRGEDGGMTEIPPCGHVIRVSMTRTRTGSVGGVATYASVAGPVEGLEHIEPLAHAVVVSRIARMAMVEQGIYVFRIYTPGTLIRNDAGQPIGCDGLDQ